MEAHSWLQETGVPHPAGELRKAPQSPPGLLGQLGATGARYRDGQGKGRRVRTQGQNGQIAVDGLICPLVRKCAPMKWR